MWDDRDPVRQARKGIARAIKDFGINFRSLESNLQTDESKAWLNCNTVTNNDRQNPRIVASLMFSCLLMRFAKELPRSDPHRKAHEDVWTYYAHYCAAFLERPEIRKPWEYLWLDMFAAQQYAIILNYPHVQAAYYVPPEYVPTSKEEPQI